MRQGLGFSIIVWVFLCAPVWAVNGDMGVGTNPNTDGSQAYPWLIEDVNDFDEFAGDSDYWAAGVHTKLMTDIDLSGRTYTTAVIAPDTSTGTYFQGTKFTGIFDGDEHIISNLKITASDKEYVGLFGFLDSTSQIKNLRIENIDVQGNSSVGGIAGWNNSGILSNCSSTGSVSGYNYVGGIVGQNHGGTITNCNSAAIVTGTNTSAGGLCGENNNMGTLSQCYADGMVSGKYSVGGLCGENRGTIDYSYANAIVSGTSSRIGGLCGENEVTINYCYATGIVTGGAYVGGLCGQNEGTINQSYATSEVTGNVVGGLCGYNSSFLATISKSYAIGEVLSSFDEAGGFCGRNESRIENCFWDVETTARETSAGGWGLTTTEMKEMTYYSSNGWVDTEWTLPESSYPRLAWEEAGGVAISDPEVIMTGNGTKDDPWLITNMTDFVQFNSGTFFWDKHYLLRADLNMSGIQLKRVGYDLANCFTGHFDGNGHTISNVTRTLPDDDYVGFFGVIGYGGQVQDLGLLNTNILGRDHVGGLCGQNSGNINRSYTAGTVEGDQYVGGLCGNHDSGIISQSYANCTVAGDDTVGGLCGENRGTIGQSYAEGAVTGRRLVGGMIGYNHGSLINCYTTASTSGEYFIGGMTGSNYGSISTSYSIGSVIGTGTNVGGFAGSNEWGDIGSSFWDIETSGATTSFGGVGKTTAELQTLSTFINVGWDFVNEVENGLHDFWQMAPSEYPHFIIHFWTLEGEGTATNPYIVTTPADLGKIWLRPSSSYVLGNNLNLEGISWSTAIIQNFSGVFDGRFFFILNLRINQPISNNVGLFGYVETGGYIRNLNLQNVYIRGYSNVGGLCGYVAEGVQISNNNITGNVRGYYAYAGGLCGQSSGGISYSNTSTTTKSLFGAGGLCGNNEGTVKFSYATGAVESTLATGGLCGENRGIISKSYATGAVDGDEDTGGLCGHNWSGIITQSCAIGMATGNESIGGMVGHNSATIANCYATGSANGVSYVGGMVGNNHGGTITNCYSIGSPSGDNDVGGLIGYKHSGTVAASFWDTQTSGTKISDGGTGKTTVQMQTLNTFTDAGWDFVGEDANGTSEIWRMCIDGVDYSRLNWQFSKNSDFVCPDGVGIEDIEALSQCWLAVTDLATELDDDSDTIVGLSELARLGEYWMQTSCEACGGIDASGDGNVNSDDLVDIINDWLRVVSPDCELCDINSDGQVNLQDYAVLGENWQN